MFYFGSPAVNAEERMGLIKPEFKVNLIRAL
jgi:hypothetical protein